jgi:hypothetical protein
MPGACLLFIPPAFQAPALTTYADLTRLPRTPGALSSYLRRHSTCPPGIPPTFREWGTVTAILANDLVMPPGLSRALFETAAKIPGSVVLRAVTDAAGGHGIAVAMSGPPVLRLELIFAPGSYRFIGAQEVATRAVAGLRAGTVLGASSLVSARVVNTAPTASPSAPYAPQTCGYTPWGNEAGWSRSGSSVSSGSGPSGP